MTVTGKGRCNVRTFDEEVAAATKDGKTKWPLDCGCKSDHYYAKCATHVNEYHEDMARRMGIVDLQYPGKMLDTDQGRDQVLQEIRKRLSLHPTKICLIKFTPEAR